MSSFIVFLLFPTYSKGNGGLGFLPKSTSCNVNASLTDLEVIVLKPYTVPFLQANLQPILGNAFSLGFYHGVMLLCLSLL